MAHPVAEEVLHVIKSEGFHTSAITVWTSSLEGNSRFFRISFNIPKGQKSHDLICDE
jgi:hypothetical protein